MIIQNNISFDYIKDIVNINTNLKRHFRYFDSRDKSCFDNHLYHFILNDPTPVGYGHLDYDEGKMWLGMCVFDDCVGLGYGKLILDTLIKNRNLTELFLSVDKENYKAINLYLSNGFKIYDQTEHIYFCNLK